MENNIVEILKYSSVSIFIYIILFNTNVIYEYTRNIRLLRYIFKIDDYEKYQELTGDKEILYLSYVSTIYNNFFIKLATCPLCIGFWLNLILSVISGDIFNIFIFYVISVILYGVFKKVYGTNP